MQYDYQRSINKKKKKTNEKRRERKSEIIKLTLLIWPLRIWLLCGWNNKIFVCISIWTQGSSLMILPYCLFFNNWRFSYKRGTPSRSSLYRNNKEFNCSLIEFKGYSVFIGNKETLTVKSIDWKDDIFQTKQCMSNKRCVGNIK